MKVKQLVGMLTCLVMLMFAISCGDDEPEPSKFNLEADIDFSPENPAVNEEITLDASGSVDADAIGFTAEWTLLSQPAGSTTEITNADAIIASLIPDVEGDYEVQLKISNADEGVSDTKTVTINALAPGYVELSGFIDSDMTLENINLDPALIDYLVTGDVSVLAVLTVEPGVVIHFQEDKMMKIEQGGTLLAAGTETDSIIFTTANKEADLFWKGLYIQSASAQNILKYAEVSYAGNTAMDFNGADYKAGVGVNGGGNIKIENSLFASNKGYGVYLDDDGGKLNTFKDNLFVDNENGMAVWAETAASVDNTTAFTNSTNADVEIFASSIAEATETTWKALSNDARYTVSGDIDVNGVLNVAPGAKFGLDEDVMITVDGAFIAAGTAESPIEFTTSDATSALRWKGIYVNSADGRNILNYVTLSYAGNSVMNFSGEDFSAGVGIEPGAKMAFKNSTFSNNKGYGVYADDAGGQIGAFENNTLTLNDRAVGLPADQAEMIDGASVFTDNANADVEIFESDFAESKTSTWKKLSGGAAYRLSGDMDVNGKLTIAAGAIVNFDENVLVRVFGSLTAVGTATDRIVFTTSNPGGELYWKGIYISSASSLNNFDFTDFSFAGNSPIDFSGADFAAAIGVDITGKVSVTNSTFTNNKDYGIYADESGGQIGSFGTNSFSDNKRGVGIPADEVDAMDGASTFTNNSFADVEVFGSDLAQDKVVTWKSLTTGASYRITGNIRVYGKVTVEAGASFKMDEDVQILVDGAFTAKGTSNNMITFTSSNIDGGLHWKGFYFSSTDASNEFDFCNIAYGGNSPHDFNGADFPANIAVNSDGKVTVTNSTISNSSGYGIYSKGVTNDFAGAGASNTFTGNTNGNNQE
jgi:hypothetical protein